MKLNADVGHWDWDKAAVATAGKPVMALQALRKPSRGGNIARPSRSSRREAGTLPRRCCNSMCRTASAGASSHGIVAAGELELRNGGVWASVGILVPAVPTENLDFCVWTFATAEFSISDMEIRRLP